MTTDVITADCLNYENRIDSRAILAFRCCALLAESLNMATSSTPRADSQPGWFEPPLVASQRLDLAAQFRVAVRRLPPTKRRAVNRRINLQMDFARPNLSQR
jgi:hypothetical protein